MVLATESGFFEGRYLSIFF